MVRRRFINNFIIVNRMGKSLIKCGKGGQLTIFIIVAILIVSAIAIIVYVGLPSPKDEVNWQTNPKGAVEKCIKDSLNSAVPLILLQGGLKSPTKYLLFNSTKVEYACYTAQNKELCVISSPLIKRQIESELEADTKDKTESCFYVLKNNFKNSEVKMGATDYQVSISPGIITGTVKKEITITQNADVLKFTQFEYSGPSPIFEMLLLSNDILTRETTCNCGVDVCSGDVVELSRMNTNYELELFVTGRNEKIYTIRDTLTKLEFNFAVRNCVRLP